MTITRMMITSTPIIVPISPLFKVLSFRCPDKRLGRVRAVVRVWPSKAIPVYNVKHQAEGLLRYLVIRMEGAYRDV